MLDRTPRLPARERRALSGIGSDFVPYTGAIYNVDLGAFTLTTTGYITAGTLNLYDKTGIKITYAADEDVDIIELSGITGDPKLYWDESEDRFRITKGFYIDVNLAVAGAATIVGLTNTGTLSVTGLATVGALDVDTLNLNGNEITDSGGTISLVDDNLTTTGDISANDLTLTGQINLPNGVILSASAARLEVNKNTEVSGAGQVYVRANYNGVRTSFMEMRDFSTQQGQINKDALTGNAIIRFSPRPLDNTSDAKFDFFRSTNTAGAVVSNYFIGNGTGTTYFWIDAKNGNVHFDSDGGKAYFGLADDASINYDGTDLHINSHEVGSGHIVLDSPKTTTGDPAGVEGKIYWNTVDNVIKMYADGGWRTLASW